MKMLHFLQIILWVNCAILLLSCQNKIATYEGYIKDSQGKAIEDVSVVVIKDIRSKKIGNEVRSDENGYYKVNLSDSIVHVGFAHPMYKRIMVPLTLTKAEIDRNQAKIKALDVVLQSDPRYIYYTGKVVDENGKPLKDVHIIGSGGGVMGKTSRKGMYTIGFCVGNCEQEIKLSKTG